MSSILPAARFDGGGFRQRLAAGRAMLGAMLDETVPELPTGSLDGLDFVVVHESSPYVLVRRVREQYRNRLPVLVLMLSGAEGPAASGVVAEAATGSTGADGAGLELSEIGPARLVTSVPAAIAAFGSGAMLVVYDLPRMVSELVAGLGAGRPEPAVPQVRTPVVMVSGMLGDATLWDGVASRLADVALPIPARIDLDDSVAEMAASVLASAPERFALVAHSLGAIVALEIMRQQPERVTRLALLNASARGASEPQVAAWSRSQRRVAAGEFGEIADELAAATLAPSRRHELALVESNRAMADTVGTEGFLRQLSAQISRPDSRDSIRDITVPVLVLSGELDEVCPPALQRELAERCPTAELVTIPGSGHMSPLESPDAVAAALLSWLQPQ